MGFLSERLGLLNLCNVQCFRIDVKTGSGRQEIYDNQPDEKGECRNQLKVDQRLYADPSEFLEIGDRGDAMNHRAKNDRRDDHLDQVDESVPQRFQAFAKIGKLVSDQNAEKDRDQYLDVENRI